MEKNDSATALSWQAPVLPTESPRPLSLANGASSFEVYREPLPERDIAFRATYPSRFAIKGAPVARGVRMCACIDQPATMRVHRSMTTARHGQPSPVLR
jgi:hypothetical protein